MNKNHLMLSAAAAAVIMIAPLALGTIAPATNVMADETQPTTAVQGTTAADKEKMNAAIGDLIAARDALVAQGVPSADESSTVSNGNTQLKRANAIIEDVTGTDGPAVAAAKASGWDYTNSYNTGKYLHNIPGKPTTADFGPNTINMVRDQIVASMITSLQDPAKAKSAQAETYVLTSAPTVATALLSAADFKDYSENTLKAQQAIVTAAEQQPDVVKTLPLNTQKNIASAAKAVANQTTGDKQAAAEKVSTAVAGDVANTEKTVAAATTNLTNAINGFKKQFPQPNTAQQGMLNKANALLTSTDPSAIQLEANALNETAGLAGSTAQIQGINEQQAKDRAAKIATAQSPYASSSYTSTTSAAVSSTAATQFKAPVKRNNDVTIRAVAKTTQPTVVVDDHFNATSQKLTKGSNWKVSGITIAPNGQVYYKVGTNRFILADVANLSMNAVQSNSGNGDINVKRVATIKYVPGYGIQVWKNDFKTMVKNADGSAKKLADKTSWKVSAIVKHDGHVFYRVGSNQYIDASYATLK